MEQVQGSIGICELCGVPTKSGDLCPTHEALVFGIKKEQSK